MGEIAGAIAVLITLLYVARQIRQSNRQNLLGAYQHTIDSMNSVCTLASQNPELGAIVLSGRQSYESLDSVERFQFDHFHFHILNIIESHLYQSEQTALDEEYRNWARENLELIVQAYLDFPGTRSFWKNAGQFAPPAVRTLVSASLSEAKVDTDDV